MNENVHLGYRASWCKLPDFHVNYKFLSASAGLSSFFFISGNKAAKYNVRMWAWLTGDTLLIKQVREHDLLGAVCHQHITF